MTPAVGTRIKNSRVQTAGAEKVVEAISEVVLAKARAARYPVVKP